MYDVRLTARSTPSRSLAPHSVHSKLGPSLVTDRAAALIVINVATRSLEVSRPMVTRHHTHTRKRTTTTTTHNHTPAHHRLQRHLSTHAGHS